MTQRNEKELKQNLKNIDANANMDNETNQLINQIIEDNLETDLEKVPKIRKRVDLLDSKIKKKLKTENIFKVLNQFIIPVISKRERDFLEELEDFLLKEIEPKIDYKKLVYNLFPILGKVNLLQRINPHNMRRVGFRFEIILAICLSIIDPELDLARVVSGIIFSNPLYQHGRDNPKIRKMYEEVITGKKIGCICITERNHGSDAVNMETRIKDMGDHLILSGEKIFTTNGPVADYFIVYGVEDPAKPRQTMYQVLVERGMKGLETNRINIASAPRVAIGQTIFHDVKIPKENILGDKGIGYQNLFKGLVAERDAIIGSSLGISWLVAVSALIYANFRKQFGIPIYEFQSVSYPLTELFVDLMAATELGFKSAGLYDKFFNSSKYENRPDVIKFGAAFSSGTKFLTAKLAHQIAYESQHLCGGVAYTDNMKIDRAVEVAKLQEIIGGTRNIQLNIVSRSIKNMIKKL
ncbi:MAG: acyl-CoA dehydrogenase [Promethearchaeota archaeon]